MTTPFWQGITIKNTIGLGDAIQFSSVPENYFHFYGKKLHDVSRHWIFDYNPYVLREEILPPKERITELWNYTPHPRPRDIPVYTCNAELGASALGINKLVLNRPRFYLFENAVEFPSRQTILIQPEGRSHGVMPDHVIDHVKKKYGDMALFQIGLPGQKDLGISKIETPSIWDLISVISRARMLICVDSAPAWIASAYPDVIVKKLRTKPNPEAFHDWVPLAVDNIHSYWDDRSHQIYNVTDQDIGFTWSYKRI